jgi:hypothetical protein
VTPKSAEEKKKEQGFLAHSPQHSKRPVVLERLSNRSRTLGADAVLVESVRQKKARMRITPRVSGVHE